MITRLLNKLILAIVIVCCEASSFASTLGVSGNTYPIAEQDGLTVIEDRVHNAKLSNIIDRQKTKGSMPGIK